MIKRSLFQELSESIQDFDQDMDSLRRHQVDGTTLEKTVCTSCFEADYEIQPFSFEVEGGTVNTECEKCPKCGDIVFTHQQSLDIDRQRRALLQQEE